MFSCRRQQSVLSSDMFQYPGRELGDPCADTWQVGLGTANPPRDDPGQEEATILCLGLKRYFLLFQYIRFLI